MGINIYVLIVKIFFFYYVKKFWYVGNNGFNLKFGKKKVIRF